MTESLNNILHGDAKTVLSRLPDECVNCCITSPPYWGLRDYDVDGQIGKEDSPETYINTLIDVFTEIDRVLKPDGTCFVNMGDTYAGGGAGTTKNADIGAYLRRSKYSYILPNGSAKSAVYRGTNKHKSLLMIPYRFAWEAVEKLEWKLRNIINWHKPNQMPCSAKDRFTVDFEPVFFFSKSAKYYFNQQFEPYSTPLNRWGGFRLNVMQGKSDWSEQTGQNLYRDRNMRPNPAGRNMRTTWSINTQSFKGNHFAVYPEKLAERMVLAGCPEGGVVIDPFVGAGTTCVAAKQTGRNFIGIELNPEYVEIAKNRVQKHTSDLRM
jgi:site-specific DNA-methyltransferase (adenine-specific)